MAIERRIIFSPKDLIVRLICRTPDAEGRECGAEVFVRPIESTPYGEYQCGQCGAHWNMHTSSNEAHFIRFFGAVVQSESEDLAVVMEIKDPKA